MARLNEQDIRRIIRDENARQELRQNRIADVPDDIKKTHARFMKLPVLTTSGSDASGTTLSGELDWLFVVKQVVDTYWEVVKEEVNERD